MKFLQILSVFFSFFLFLSSSLVSLASGNTRFPRVYGAVPADYAHSSQATPTHSVYPGFLQRVVKAVLSQEGVNDLELPIAPMVSLPCLNTERFFSDGSEVLSGDEEGALPRIRDIEKISALDIRFHRAVRRGNIAKAHKLLLLKANINLQSPKTGKGALHQAASVANEEVLKFLLDRNCAVAQVDRKGNTALHELSEQRHNPAKALKVLLQAKANLFAKNRAGETALDKATILDNSKAVKALKQAIEKTYRKK